MDQTCHRCLRSTNSEVHAEVCFDLRCPAGGYCAKYQTEKDARKCVERAEKERPEWNGLCGYQY